MPAEALEAAALELAVPELTAEEAAEPVTSKHSIDDQQMIHSQGKRLFSCYAPIEKEGPRDGKDYRSDRSKSPPVPSTLLTSSCIRKRVGPDRNSLAVPTADETAEVADPAAEEAPEVTDATALEAALDAAEATLEATLEACLTFRTGDALTAPTAARARRLLEYMMMAIGKSFLMEVLKRSVRRGKRERREGQQASKNGVSAQPSGCPTSKLPAPAPVSSSPPWPPKFTSFATTLKTL